MIATLSTFEPPPCSSQLSRSRDRSRRDENTPGRASLLLPGSCASKTSARDVRDAAEKATAVPDVDTIKPAARKFGNCNRPYNPGCRFTTALLGISMTTRRMASSWTTRSGCPDAASAVTRLPSARDGRSRIRELRHCGRAYRRQRRRRTQRRPDSATPCALPNGRRASSPASRQLNRHQCIQARPTSRRARRARS